MASDKPPLKPDPGKRPVDAPERRTARAEMHVPATVKWTAQDGTRREETTETKIVNAYGCLLFLRGAVPEGLPVEIVNLGSQQSRRGKVVWCGATEKGGFMQVGIEIEGMDEKFWGQRYVDFLMWMAKERA